LNEKKLIVLNTDESSWWWTDVTRDSKLERKNLIVSIQMRVCKSDAQTRVEVGYKLIVSNTDEMQVVDVTVREKSRRIQLYKQKQTNK